MDERFAQLFQQLLDGGLSNVSGADASITLPLSEQLLNDLIAAALPSSFPVRELHVTPLDGDRFLVRGRPGSSSFVPSLKLHVAIDRQPDFPATPLLGLRLEGTGVMAIAGMVLRMMTLPPWIRTEQDCVHVDLRALLDRYPLGRYADHIDRVRLNTVAGALVLSVHAHVR